MESTVTYFPEMSFFEDEPPEEEVDTIGEWSRKRIASLQVKLEYIERKKTFSHSRFNQILAPVIINLANEVFGFDGWSSEIKDFFSVQEEEEERFFSNIRVILKDGTFCNGEGSGTTQKQATTDGLKRAIMGFPNKLLTQELGPVKVEEPSYAYTR